MGCLNRFGRRFGFLGFAFLIMVSRARAETVVTITGTVGVGFDGAALFGAKSAPLKGLPFTVVFTFKDDVGDQYAYKPCFSTGPGKYASGEMGKGEMSPGTAVLTVAGKSFTIGVKGQIDSHITLTVNTQCSGSALELSVNEHAPLVQGMSYQKTLEYENTVTILIVPKDIPGSRTKASLTQEPDWRSSLFLENLDDPMRYNTNLSAFLLQAYTRAPLVLKTLTIIGAVPKPK